MPSPLDRDERLLLIVVGAHPRAERADRPLGIRLRERIQKWIESQSPGDLPFEREPLVLTDLWYLNADELRREPTISIGDPEVNACSAYFANRLPEAFVIDQQLRIQLDLEFVDLRACLWGSSASAAASAVAALEERYLDDFLRAAHEMRMK